jgi:hypothetical protein
MLRLHLFFDNCALVSPCLQGLRQFSICSPFPPVIVISPVSETIILCLHETSLVLFRVHLALPMVVTRKTDTSARVGFTKYL